MGIFSPKLKCIIAREHDEQKNDCYSSLRRSNPVSVQIQLDDIMKKKAEINRKQTVIILKLANDKS